MLSDAQLLVLAATPDSRAETAALLAGAVRSLANDKLITPEVTIGWGESAAAALSATSAAVRLFVLPTGRLGPSLAPPEAELLGPLLLGDESASHSLVALGCLGANAIIAPSPSAARATEGDPGLASRASDEPVIAVRFGCDDPPNDPASDTALPANFSAAALAGKAECRRAIARRCSLALGPRTLLVTTGPLQRDGGGGRDPGRNRTVWPRTMSRQSSCLAANPKWSSARGCSRSSNPDGWRCCRASMRATNGLPGALPTPSCSATIMTASGGPLDWRCSTGRCPSRPTSERTATTSSTTTPAREPATRSCTRRRRRSRSRARFAVP